MHLDFDMGKYGVYVWGAYGATFIGLVGLVGSSLIAHAHRLKVLQALQDASLDAVPPSPTIDA